MTKKLDMSIEAQRKCKCRWCKKDVRLFDDLVAIELSKCGACRGRGFYEVRGEYNVDQETCESCKGTGRRM